MDQRMQAAYWGFIVGDALGVPYEFKTREQMKANPATTMTGYGTYNQPPGTWSDDTSMMLCVLKNNLNNGRPIDLAKLFLDWYQHAEYTPHGEVFDIGITTRNAMEHIIKTRSIRESGLRNERSAGNGSLMRCLPYAFYENYSIRLSNLVIESGITHKISICTTSSIFYSKMAHSIYTGNCSLQDAIKQARGYIYHGWRITDAEDDHFPLAKTFEPIFHCDYTKKSEEDVRSTGYVLHTLDAVMWCLFNTDNYKDAVLKAVNLGGDTDTIAALTGGIAGLYYGMESIPKEWLETIANKTLINSILNIKQQPHANI